MGLLNRVTARALALDGLLALVVGVVMAFGTGRAAAFQPSRRPIDALAVALLVVAASSLTARRLAPLPALAAVTLAVAAYLARGYPFGPILLAPPIALYSAGRHLPVRRSLPAAAVAIGVLALTQLPGVDGAQGLVLLVVWHGWLLVPWALGAGLRVGREDARRNREDAARRLAYEERLRIAREVHDVVGHGLAVINMQAGVALHVVDRRPEQARVALAAIKETSKDALEELRATLAVVRRPDEDRQAPRPAPGLRQVGSVVTAMAESGLPVRLEVAGRAVDLPAAVDLAAYRIVQESLTNVIRHAGPASATVRVRYEPDDVVLEITDDGRARANGSARPGGQGIAGMRERAAAVHGSLEAGPRPEGGFQVLARLPSRGLPT
ncbi:MAG TPA: sensor histidine kinase [Terriglobales bacterium]|nr:sensor histidine kinase [Terriglobales bacterium]